MDNVAHSYEAADAHGGAPECTSFGDTNGPDSTILSARDQRRRQDADLVRAISRGDEQAEARFYELFYPLVLARLRKRMGPNEDALDLTQDTLLTVLCKLRRDGLSDPEGLSGYVSRTAEYTFIGFCRKGANRRTWTMEDIPDIEFSYSDDQTDRLIARERGEEVREGLSRLNQARDRDLLTQFYLLGQSKSVICENLGLSADHFDRVAYRARARLRNLFEVHTVAELT